MRKVVEKIELINIFEPEKKIELLAEPKGIQPLVGQIILEQLDLIVDPRAGKVIPNQRLPEMPMVEILMTTSPDSGYAVSLTQTLTRFTYPPTAICRFKKNEEEH